MLDRSDQETSNFIDLSAISHLPFCEVYSRHFSSKWNQSVVSDAMDFTQKLSGADQAQAKDTTWSEAGKPTESRNASRIGLVSYGLIPNSERAVFCQETRELGWKWSSRDIQVGDVDSVHLAKGWLEPIKQIFM